MKKEIITIIITEKWTCQNLERNFCSHSQHGLIQVKIRDVLQLIRKTQILNNDPFMKMTLKESFFFSF